MGTSALSEVQGPLLTCCQMLGLTAGPPQTLKQSPGHEKVQVSVPMPGLLWVPSKGTQRASPSVLRPGDPPMVVCVQSLDLWAAGPPPPLTWALQAGRGVWEGSPLHDPGLLCLGLPPPSLPTVRVTWHLWGAPSKEAWVLRFFRESQRQEVNWCPRDQSPTPSFTGGRSACLTETPGQTPATQGFLQVAPLPLLGHRGARPPNPPQPPAAAFSPSPHSVEHACAHGAHARARTPAGAHRCTREGPHGRARTRTHADTHTGGRARTRARTQAQPAPSRTCPAILHRGPRPHQPSLEVREEKAAADLRGGLPAWAGQGEGPA